MAVGIEDDSNFRQEVAGTGDDSTFRGERHLGSARLGTAEDLRLLMEDSHYEPDPGRKYLAESDPTDDQEANDLLNILGRNPKLLDGVIIGYLRRNVPEIGNPIRREDDGPQAAGDRGRATHYLEQKGGRRYSAEASLYDGPPIPTKQKIGKKVRRIIDTLYDILHPQTPRNAGASIEALHDTIYGPFKVRGGSSDGAAFLAEASLLSPPPSGSGPGKKFLAYPTDGSPTHPLTSYEIVRTILDEFGNTVPVVHRQIKELIDSYNPEQPSRRAGGSSEGAFLAESMGGYQSKGGPSSSTSPQYSAVKLLSR